MMIIHSGLCIIDCCYEGVLGIWSDPDTWIWSEDEVDMPNLLKYLNPSAFDHWPYPQA